MIQRRTFDPHPAQAELFVCSGCQLPLERNGSNLWISDGLGCFWLYHNACAPMRDEDLPGMTAERLAKARGQHSQDISTSAFQGGSL